MLPNFMSFTEQFLELVVGLSDHEIHVLLGTLHLMHATW